ncbi:MAG: PAC2 family protein [Planctomycetota bacterium]
MPLKRPWLVAVWPGMGSVALMAGYYLMSKLGMHLLEELSAEELFDVEHVEVKDGLIRSGRLPRSRLFAWSDPGGQRDIVVFLGEAQPPRGRYAFCRRLIAKARELDVERIFTFAALATGMNPAAEARVFGAATDEGSLAELRHLELSILEDGQIGGLNGVLLGAAAEAGLQGACLLGEMPHLFTQLPFPKASLAVLRLFADLARIDLDFGELQDQADAMERQLGNVLERLRQQLQEQPRADEADEESWAAEQENGLPPEDKMRIERLFGEATKDRSKAYELKRELDRLGVFAEYEDRFLDIFRTAE